MTRTIEAEPVYRRAYRPTSLVGGTKRTGWPPVAKTGQFRLVDHGTVQSYCLDNGRGGCRSADFPRSGVLCDDTDGVRPDRRGGVGRFGI